MTKWYNRRMSGKIYEFFMSKYIKRIFMFFMVVGLLYYFFQYQKQWFDLTKFGDFGDESETILVSKLIARGYVLYQDVYNNHGSLVFMPGILLYKLLGDAAIWQYRYIIVLLQDLALISIITSPITKKFWPKWVAALFIGLIFVFYLPNFYGHTYIYQNIGGYSMFIILIAYVIPSILNIELSKFRVLIMNIWLISLIFVAIIYVPFVLIVLVITFKRKSVLYCLIGLLIGLGLNYLYTCHYANWEGYYAYHIYLNSVVLYENQSILNYIETIINVFASDMFYFFTFMLLGSSLVFQYAFVKKNGWKFFLLLGLAMSLMIRSNTNYFHSLPYFYTLLALMMPELMVRNDEFTWKHYILVDALIIGVSVYLLSFPFSKYHKDFWERSTESDFTNLVEKITEPSDKILSMTFRSIDYLNSHREPASFHFIYLPIQAIYNEKPFGSVYRNIVDDLKSTQPKLVFTDFYGDFGDFDNYAYDLIVYLNKQYNLLTDGMTWVRKDINLEDFGLNKYTGKTDQNLK